MEKSIDIGLKKELAEAFGLPDMEPEIYSSLALAYIGDSVYDLVIRTLVLSEGNLPVKELHHKTSSLVQASAQSRMMRGLQELLTEEEHGVYRRGRNTRMVSPAKNQSLTDYRRATGFEALIGWLYLRDDWGRILELVRTGLEFLEQGGKQ